MLEKILRHIHNRFERSYVDGTFEVSSGTFDVDGALDGQYVWIEGSVFSDGLHQYPLEGLDDETFQGRVYLLAIPPAVVELSTAVTDWCESNSSAYSSPYDSESFGGYSYNMRSVDGTTLSGWQAQFYNELNPYRKLGSDGF